MSEVIACTICCASVSTESIKVCYPESQREPSERDDGIRAFVRLATLGAYDPFDSMTLR